MQDDFANDEILCNRIEILLQTIMKARYHF